MHYGTAGAGTRVARRSPTRARKARVSAFVALGAAAVIALAACGGSSSSSSSKSTTTKKSTGTASAAGAAVVKTAKSSTLGTIVVDRLHADKWEPAGSVLGRVPAGLAGRVSARRDDEGNRHRSEQRGRDGHTGHDQRCTRLHLLR